MDVRGQAADSDWETQGSMGTKNKWEQRMVGMSRESLRQGKQDPSWKPAEQAHQAHSRLKAVRKFYSAQSQLRPSLAQCADGSRRD